METANETGRGDLGEPLRDLKKSQDVDGDLQDRRTLVVDLTPSEREDGTQPNPFVTTVRPVLEAEIEELYARYLARRERLLEICRDTQMLRTRRLQSLSSFVTAGALAVGTGLVVAQRR